MTEEEYKKSYYSLEKKYENGKINKKLLIKKIIKLAQKFFNGEDSND